MQLKGRLTLAALATAPAIMLGVVSSTPAMAYTKPLVNYSETGSCPGAGGQAPCTTHITIDSNPSNVAVRAWEDCAQVSGPTFTLVGSWHFNRGVVSNTAGCASVQGDAYVIRAGFDARKTDTIRYQCYSFIAGNARSGLC